MDCPDKRKCSAVRLLSASNAPLGLPTPAEAAAEDQLVNLALVGGQARHFQYGREGCLAVLRAGPDLALVRRVERRGVERLHARMVLVGIVVDRLDLLGGGGNRCL